MTTRLKVLLLAENEDVVGLLARHLHSVGCVPELTVAWSETELRHALSDAEWDAVIVERKTWSAGMADARHMVRERVGDIPFIVVSEEVGVDPAVECAHGGASQSFSRAQLSALGPTIAREMKDAVGRRTRRRAEGALRGSEATARSIVSASSEGILIVCLLYTSPSPRDRTRSRMPSSA